jgi:hypothetical protein
MKVSQKEAVYNAITSITDVSDGQAVELDKASKSTIIDALVKGFEASEIELSSKQEDLRKYSTGLLNNWLRKDKRLNGGVEYIAKNPGSRSGNGDAVIKNLRMLLKTEGLSAEQVSTIQAEINTRLVAIKPKKEVTVDMSAIPADIKAKLGL